MKLTLPLALLALAGPALAAESGPAAPPQVSPRVRFTGADSALVEWETAQATPSVVEFGETTKPGARVADPAPVKAHALKLGGLKPETKYFFTIPSTNGPAEIASERFQFDTNFNFTIPPLATDLPDDETFGRLADEILKTTGVTRGYCLDYGCGDGRLALALARRSQLTVVGVSDDAGAIARGRQMLDAAGVYGPRLLLLHTPTDKLPFTKNCFNLIISSDGLTGKKAVTASPELARVARPAGGVTMLARGAPSVRPPLPGAGAWTHAYGDAAQTANSGDQDIVAQDMRVQWFGQPGARGMIDRQSRNPPPLTTGGRLYVQGDDRIYAQDAYNGRVLWNLEIPGLRRVNLPRDSSNMCADDTSLFVAVRDRVWRLDARSGAMARMFSAPAGRDWGYVASDGLRLIGTAIRPDSIFKDYKGSSDFWYDKPAGASIAKVCSDRIFALGKDDGRELWNYTNGMMINSTIAIGGGRICFIESRTPGLADEARSRISSPRLYESTFMVALDAATGRLLWEKPLTMPSKNPVVMYLSIAGERLVLSVSGDARYFVSAFEARDGQSAWEQSHAWSRNHHGGHMYHPVIVAGKVIAEPVGYDLATGKTVLTGLPARGGCSTMSASANCVHYINWDYDRGAVYFWDLTTGERRRMAGSRAGCWLSIISGGGLALLPASSAGCTCRFSNQNSVGFATP